MKEYFVAYTKGAMGPKKMVEQSQSLLNDMVAQGWQLKLKEGFMWVFQREIQS